MTLQKLLSVSVGEQTVDIVLYSEAIPYEIEILIIPPKRRKI
jgi:hypothetical protein